MFNGPGASTFSTFRYSLNKKPFLPNNFFELQFQVLNKKEESFLKEEQKNLFHKDEIFLSDDDMTMLKINILYNDKANIEKVLGEEINDFLIRTVNEIEKMHTQGISNKQEILEENNNNFRMF